MILYEMSLHKKIRDLVSCFPDCKNYKQEFFLRKYGFSVVISFNFGDCHYEYDSFDWRIKSNSMIDINPNIEHRNELFLKWVQKRIENAQKKFNLEQSFL